MARNVLVNGFTAKQEAFLAAYALHGNVGRAEREAGIGLNTGYAILRRPDVQQEVTDRQLARITNEALPLAVDTLLDVMRNPKSPAAARVTAAKVVLDRALPVDDNGRTKEIHELTPDELAQAIAKLEAQAADVAKDVTPGPDPFA